MRKVKCDEVKPACCRCTSTGRRCDGYNEETQKRLLATVKLSSTAVPAHPLFVTSSLSTPGLRLIRPLAPKIEGTDIEQSYVRDFHDAVDEGISHHITNGTSFWKHTVLYLSLQEPVIRHAIMALGAAFRGYRFGESSQPDIPPSETERFTLEKYGQAMRDLGETRKAPVTTTTLVCCLVFTIIECLRGRWMEGLKHLRAGLAIIDSAIPIEDLLALADPKGALPKMGQLAGDTDDVIRMFCTLELSASAFKMNFEPTIALKLFHARRARGLAVSEPTNVHEAHRATAQFCRDVCALAWNSRQGGDVAWGAQQLVTVGQRLEKTLKTFKKNPTAPRVDASLMVDKLHVASCSQLCSQLAQVHNPAHGSDAGYEEIMRLADGVQCSVPASERKGQRGRFILDVAILWPLHLVVHNCGKKTTRQRALETLRDWKRRENFWDWSDVAQNRE